ncbi:lytic transglycosylase domain-containing protein [Nocardioides sp. Arc9.136]|uniref:lytic transglycosylase domain-containing protein n=1 Tax=Nocardioides sp. Arc9.136 TaxID=2996826 RepID=UPI0026665807|nr:lytic transglycosylase domain-containing protein [Nocardioides sp. Arc9.136]WKN46597.1 lytic transglycosylase domain-containing protein [Nocardioides sp. Arc9.136]
MRRPAVALGLAAVLAVAGCGSASEDPAVPDADRTRPTGSSAAAPGGPSSSASPGATPGATPDDPELHQALVAALDAPPQPPRTAARLVDGLVAAERAIADPATAPDVLSAAAHVQQVAYRRLGQRPAWDAAVLRSVPRGLRSTVRANVASRREFQSMSSTPSDTLPAWRIVEPEPADRLLAHYRAAERRFGVDWEYLAAINLVETAMGRIRGTSVAGARGPMQFIPATWAQYGRGDIEDAGDAVMAAARYLDARGFTRPGGRARALYAYNNHPAYVRGVTRLAEVMQDRPRAYLGYHRWRVYYRSAAGDVLLPVGYERERPVPVRRWLARRSGG